MVIEEGDRVHVVLEDGKEFMVFTQSHHMYSTHQGTLAHNEIIGKKYGESVLTHRGCRAYLLQPGIIENIRFMERQTQIMYPKDIGYILLYMDIKNGDRVIDVGLGSGSMCGALARSVGHDGQVFGYERRKPFADIAWRNIQRWELTDRVTIKHRDMIEGFEEKDVDALFLDVAEPWQYISLCWNALKGGGRIAIVCPTAGKVMKTLDELERENFLKREVWETMIREYKNSSRSFRPLDRMIAHTTYLLFARKYIPEKISEEN